MIKGIHVVKKPRAGRPPLWYVYAHRGGPQIHRHEGWARPTLGTVELQRLIAEQELQVERLSRNTLGELIREWRPCSPDWKALAKSTQKTWGGALDRIEEKWGSTPLTVWNDPRMSGKVMDWRNSRADTPRAADVGVTVLRALLEYGRLRGRLQANVAKGIPQLYRNGSRAEIIWTHSDIEAFAAASRELGASHVYDAVRLAALTGLRREDLVTLRWDEIMEHAIVKKAHKTSRGKRRKAVIPRLAELDDLLSDLKSRSRCDGVETVLVNSRGRSWSGDGFSTSFSVVRDRANIVHVDAETGEVKKKHLHDLRGTFCTKLFLAGLTNQQVADIMAWSPEQVAGIRRTYVDQGAVAMAIGERLSGQL